MADVAIRRIQLIDNSQRREDGARIHRILPWQIVTPDGGIAMLEPVDYVSTTASGSTTKQITGILFVDAGVFRAQTGGGGDSGAFRYA